MSFKSMALQSHTVNETQTFTDRRDRISLWHMLFWETPMQEQAWMLQDVEK